MTIATLTDAVEAFISEQDPHGVDAVGSSMGARMVLGLARRGVGGSTVALDPGGFWSSGRSERQRSPSWLPSPPATTVFHAGGNRVVASERGQARRRLAALAVTVSEVADDTDLPFGAGCFDLVVSRHPVVTVWPEVARVLRPSGVYLSQQVGVGSNQELIEAMMGPQPRTRRRCHPGRRAPRGRPARRVAGDGVLRRGCRRALPAQGPLDGPGLHRRRLLGPARFTARPDRPPRPLRGPLTALPDRVPQAG